MRSRSHHAISRLLPVIALGAMGWGSPAPAQSATPEQVWSARQLDVALDSVKGMVKAYAIPSAPGVHATLIRRDRDGEPEIHMAKIDAIVIREGHATMLIGGTVTGNHETDPGEFRGGAIEGGRKYELNPGDFLSIPAGVPHQVFVPKGQTFTYLALKFPLTN